MRTRLLPAAHILIVAASACTLTDFRPPFPEEAIASGVQGTVIAMTSISARLKPEKIRVDGPPLLAKALRDYIRTAPVASSCASQKIKMSIRYALRKCFSYTPLIAVEQGQDHSWTVTSSMLPARRGACRRIRAPFPFSFLTIGWVLPVAPPPPPAERMCAAPPTANP